MYAMLQVCDVVAISSAFLLAGLLRDEKWLSPQGQHIVILVLPIFLLFAYSRESYSIDSLRSLSESVRRPLSAFFATSLIIFMFTFFSKSGSDLSRLAFGTAFVGSVTLIVCGRLLVHRFVWWKWKGNILDQLIIIDGTPILPGCEMHRCIDARKEGLYPDPMDPHRLSELSALVKGYDRIIVSCSDERRADWSLFLKGSDITGEIVVPDNNKLGAIGIGELNGTGTYIVSRGTLSFVNRVKKRGFDLAVTVPLFLFLLPLLIVTAIAIKLDSSGPVFFRQPRVGQANRIFNIYKFRSMCAQDSDENGNISASIGDVRITRVGRFIRKTSIDELPQLINVLRNEMSVVGPRPHALGSLAGNKLFWEINQEYWLRHALKPGITGLAQIRGHRGATHDQQDLELRLQSDLEYLQGWRLWRDVTILIGTVRVLIHPNAY